MYQSNIFDVSNIKIQYQIHYIVTQLHPPRGSINQRTGRMYSRIVIILVLFGIFFRFFGYVSFQKYLQGGTMIDRKLKYPEELDAPALLVCPINTNNANGFKDLTEEEIYSKTFCKSAKDSEEFFSCFEENTYMFVIFILGIFFIFVVDFKFVIVFEVVFVLKSSSFL